MEKKQSFFLALLLTALIAFNVYIFSNLHQQKQTAVIMRVIDGDTVVLEDGTTIRLNNINTPEKNQPGYEEAKSFLSSFENKSVEIRKIGIDKYGRILAGIYAPEYVNLLIIEKGLASKFLVDKSEIKLFVEAERLAIDNSLGLWKKSPYFNCFESEINPFKETIFLKNNCNLLNINNWRLKEEGRKEYKFANRSIGEVTIHTFEGENNETDLFWGINKDVWNNDRDTLYLFDEDNLLAHYNSYGY